MPLVKLFTRIPHTSHSNIGSNLLTVLRLPGMYLSSILETIPDSSLAPGTGRAPRTPTTNTYAKLSH